VLLREVLSTHFSDKEGILSPGHVDPDRLRTLNIGTNGSEDATYVWITVELRPLVWQRLLWQLAIRIGHLYKISDDDRWLISTGAGVLAYAYPSHRLSKVRSVTKVPHFQSVQICLSLI
jgi:hypothetical protein